jgi:ribosomal protein S18 acetylase RimI-like enzyme
MADEASRDAAARMAVRRAGPEDARAIAEVSVAGWQAAYRGILPDEFLDSLRVDARERGWHEMLARDELGRTPAWVAEENGRVAGFVSCGPPRDDDVPLPGAEVYAIYVRPERWRGGLGRALLDAATVHLREQGAQTLVLWVLEANHRARGFYEAMGWRPDGGRRELDLGGTSPIEIRYRFVG